MAELLADERPEYSLQIHHKLCDQTEAEHKTPMVFLMQSYFSRILCLSLHPLLANSLCHVCICFWDRQWRFQTEFLCRHHIYWLICWLYYMSDFPLLFTFTSPQLQHETIVLLGLQTALQMLYSFLFQGHPFVIHHIFHSVNNLD